MASKQKRSNLQSIPAIQARLDLFADRPGRIAKGGEQVAVGFSELAVKMLNIAEANGADVGRFIASLDLLDKAYMKFNTDILVGVIRRSVSAGTPQPVLHLMEWFMEVAKLHELDFRVLNLLVDFQNVLAAINRFSEEAEFGLCVQQHVEIAYSLVETFNLLCNAVSLFAKMEENKLKAAPFTGPPSPF
jgi:hypothetical protein